MGMGHQFNPYMDGMGFDRSYSLSCQLKRKKINLLEVDKDSIYIWTGFLVLHPFDDIG